MISRSSVRPAQRANQDALGPAPSHGLAGPREDQVGASQRPRCFHSYRTRPAHPWPATKQRSASRDGICRRALRSQAILAARGSSRRNVIARVSRRSLMGAVSVGGAVSALQWAMPRAGKASAASCWPRPHLSTVAPPSGLPGDICGSLHAVTTPRLQAFTLPPPGFSYHVDQIDGYSFYYPSEWIQVTSSGNDVFYRNVRNLGAARRGTLRAPAALGTRQWRRSSIGWVPCHPAAPIDRRRRERVRLRFFALDVAV